jgi:hypothetical protein
MAQLNHNLLINALTAEMLIDSPRALWPLDEPFGAVSARNVQSYKMGSLKPQRIKTFAGYGISSISVSSGTATVNTTSNISLDINPGDYVLIEGASSNVNNGTWLVLSVTSLTSFTISSTAMVAQASSNGTVTPVGVLTELGGLLFGSVADKNIGTDKANSVYMAASRLGDGYCLSTDTMPDWAPPAVDNETIELMYYPTEFGINGNGLFALTGSFAQETRGQFLAVSVDALGYLQLYGFMNPNTVYGGPSVSYGSFIVTWTSDNPVITLQEWNHIALTQSVDGSNNVTMKLYVDGVLVSMSYGGTSSTSMTYNTQDSTTHTFQQAMDYQPKFIVGAFANNVANTDGNSSVSLYAPGRGYFANAAIYYSTLSDARIAEHARIVNGFSGDTTHQRFNRLCGYANLPANNYTTLGTALVSMSAQPLTDGEQAGRSLFDAIKEVADTEYGDVYVNGSGKIVHSGRQLRMNPSVDFTVPARAINADNGFDYDQTVLINKATATSGTGYVSQSSDASSVSQYGPQEIQISIFADTDNQVISSAYGLARLQSTPAPRLRDVAIDFVTLPSTLSGQLETMLATKVSDVFQITDLPTASAPTSTLTMFIEGWSDRISENSWQRALSTTAVTSPYAPVFTLDDSTYGVLSNSPKLTW